MFRWEIIDLTQNYEILIQLLSDPVQVEIYRKKLENLSAGIKEIDSTKQFIGEDDFYDLKIEDTLGKLDKEIKACFQQKFMMAIHLLRKKKDELTEKEYSNYQRCFIAVKDKVNCISKKSSDFIEFANCVSALSKETSEPVRLLKEREKCVRLSVQVAGLYKELETLSVKPNEKKYYANLHNLAFLYLSPGDLSINELQEKNTALKITLADLKARKAHKLLVDSSVSSRLTVTGSFGSVPPARANLDQNPSQTPSQTPSYAEAKTPR